MQQKNDAWLKRIPPEVGHYLAGFADGEGSFIVSLRQRMDHTLGWQVVLTFNVAQKESYILAQFKRYLGCGRVQERKDGVCYYVCANPLAIQERVIPFFKRFVFRSQRKKKNFSIFCQIVEKVFRKEHLTQVGLNEIIQLREELNFGRGRTRKFSLSDYEKTQKENPQRLYAKPRVFRKERNADDIVRSHR
ncbi:MAG: LAGLIDADG family homing endonuclease [Candidatus Moranbacteria bacterium]|nr:LAGLIDADG family homing endonuclease [Candidatus Moranbacteria bacterium]